jgi:glycosyltransferase involved in cell wall biosynthesis
MRVSVIVPAKNAAVFLVEAIVSVLAQGRDVDELIIVDDNSTDESVSIARGFADSRIRVIANCGSGVSAARNTGARAASGDWLMFLDSDDRLRPGAIAALLRGAASQPQAIVIYGDYSRVDKNGRRIGLRHLLRGRAKPSGRVLGQLVSGNFIVNGGVMIVRAASFAATAGFDEALRYCEDWHCWCRLAALGEFRFISDLLLDYRIHSANTMSAAMRSPQDFLPSAERVFRDLAIVGQLPSHLVLSLRRAADVHLIAFAATQAVRFHEYGKARAYMAMAVRRSPAAAPGVLLRIVSAYLGI